jgi:hypothetical protein
MEPKNYEYQSAFARRYHRQGIREGIKEGQVKTLIQLIKNRFGTVSPQLRRRLRAAPTGELDRIARRLLTANTAQEALGKVWRS